MAQADSNAHHDKYILASPNGNVSLPLHDDRYTIARGDSSVSSSTAPSIVSASSGIRNFREQFVHPKKPAEKPATCPIERDVSTGGWLTYMGLMPKVPWGKVRSIAEKAQEHGEGVKKKVGDLGHSIKKKRLGKGGGEKKTSPSGGAQRLSQAADAGQATVVAGVPSNSKQAAEIFLTEGPQYEYHTASNTAAFVTFLKALFGAGLLAQPSILGEVGLTLGIIAFSIIAVGCTFACYVLLQARSLAQHIHARTEKVSDAESNLVTYGDLARTLLGERVAVLTTYTIVTMHVLFASGMVNVAVTNLATYLEWDRGPSEEVAHRALSCILLPIIVMLLQIPRLADLFYISALGLIVYMVGCVGSVLYAVIRSNESHTPEDMWETKWEGIPYFVASTVYAIEGINLALPTVNSMEDTSKAVPVVCFGVMSYGVMSLGIAVFGYVNGIGGGDDRHDPEECRDVAYCLSSQNLRNMHIVSLAIALVLTLPVILYPSTEMLEMFIYNKRKQRKEARERKIALLRGELTEEKFQEGGTEMVVVDGSNYNPLLEVLSKEDEDIRWREQEEENLHQMALPEGHVQSPHNLHSCDDIYNPVIEMMMEAEFSERLVKRQIESSDDVFWQQPDHEIPHTEKVEKSNSDQGLDCDRVVKGSADPSFSCLKHQECSSGTVCDKQAGNDDETVIHSTNIDALCSAGREVDLCLMDAMSDSTTETLPDTTDDFIQESNPTSPLTNAEVGDDAARNTLGFSTAGSLPDSGDDLVQRNIPPPLHVDTEVGDEVFRNMMLSPHGRSLLDVTSDAGTSIIEASLVENTVSQSATQTSFSQDLPEHPNESMGSVHKISKYASNNGPRHKDKYQPHPIETRPLYEKNWKLRMTLAFLITIIGAFEEHFSGIISFLRGVGLSFAGFILPPILYICAREVSGLGVMLNSKMMFALASLIGFGLFNMVLVFISSFTDKNYYDDPHHDHH